jgi:hypothetical protein
MNFSDLGPALRGLANDLSDDLGAAEERNLEDLEAECHRFSQGTLTLREIARIRGYSRKRGPRLNPNLVNRHTREFEGGWRSVGPQAKGGAVESEVWNESQVAQFFQEGTDVMVARHPEEAAADVVEERRVERLDRALGKHLE